ncbi:RrF2 family transcriptional regulator [Rhodospirillum sp. A1_3_36]|uniref:RrF2 family transcriptional regulator n=1 Tax=Rhodospirillum sp. A1_3_36 TaxID=3391666 RepID=UPI0039A4C0F4
MKQDSRLSGVLHILLHMAGQNAPLSSEVLAKAMNTNPVVVRRVMAGLRNKGYVRSEKGHGGGWTLTRSLAEITLADVYDALGRPTILALGHRDPKADCLIEQAVNAALDTAFHEAEALLHAQFARVTLAQLSLDFEHRLAERGLTRTGDAPCPQKTAQ